ncbi:MAG TPA: YitT family protein [Bacteroidales bacterium]|nr:YitT family protein [Bacteroidales bacterium]
MIWKEVRSYLLITIGLILNAIGWNAFLIPSEIIGGGLVGIASILWFTMKIPIGLTVLVGNAILVALAIKLIGAKFGIKTIVGIVINAIVLSVFQLLFKDPLVTDKFMAAIIGATLCGGGLGIVFAQGSASGGTDIIALIINYYKNITPGRVILICDIIIIGSTYFIFHSIEKVMYGYVVMAVVSYVIDLVMEGNKQSYQFMIFSKQNQQIADRITNEVGRGVSVLKGIGWYTKEPLDVLVVICRRTDRNQILSIIKDEDNKAFFSITKVAAAYGLNFERIKI